MLVVTVRFAVKKEHSVAFNARVRKQAADSLALEDDCHHFDIAARVGDPSKIFLYEIYADEAAFQEFIRSEAFRAVTKWGKEQILSSRPQHKIYKH